MSRLQTFQVFPCIPEPFHFSNLVTQLMVELDYDAKELFRRIDPRLWKGAARRNPVLFLDAGKPPNGLRNLQGQKVFYLICSG